MSYNQIWISGSDNITRSDPIKVDGATGKLRCRH
jgi:hypothetical protein